MKILMLSPMISSSSFITTYPYAKILSKEHDVKIVGPLFGKNPYIDDNNLNLEFVEPVVTRPVQLGMLSLFGRNLNRLMKGDYDVVHAFKLLPHTAPAAAAAKRKLGKKFALTVDDYDAAGGGSNPLKKMFLRKAEKSFKDSDLTFTSSSKLQSMYGGEVVYQVPNEDIFMKNKTDGSETRKKLGIKDETVILYAGTLYDHKGVDVLIKSVKKLGRDDVKLVIAGGTLGNKEVESYKKLAGNETIFAGQVPISSVPDLVAACDIYAIPTKDTEYTRAEIPAKIFEPMMLGKPVVASDISDIPIILDGGKSGLLSEPGSVDKLSENISSLVSDSGLRKKIGRAGNKRYMKNYSYSAIGPRILNAYRKLEAGT